MMTQPIDDGSQLSTVPRSSHTVDNDERRLALVRAAYAEIAEKGFEGLRLRRVAAVVGINQATIHYYFPTKEALIKDVAEYIVGLNLSANTTLYPQAQDGETSLSLFQRYTAELQRRIPEDALLFRAMCELFLRAGRDERIHRLIVKTDALWEAYLINILDTGMQEGTIRKDLELQSTARMIIAFVKGITLQLDAQPDDITRCLEQLELLLRPRP
ncbi:TetR/AcrR family transcriptional regulator [Dictyobacter arantiisoli]|uniref:HTH tetR-type domain-containing protein n=1 Tax=Dictyobacter arantiisoli TaxID=2014874 RepID=A0A5A5THY4_9CHLR|nr:TetR/AcrR family transcriptional regulator [Dictyobacter arantiisoli]GCF10818.1 hypothetical protein KDI_43820 [Dictyobacter arantiisoli]